MFLARRSAQAEYFDAPERTASELQAHYDWLNRINRATRFDRPFRMWIPRLLEEREYASLEILDVGAGDGELGRTLSYDPQRHEVVGDAEATRLLQRPYRASWKHPLPTTV